MKQILLPALFVALAATGQAASSPVQQRYAANPLSHALVAKTTPPAQFSAPQGVAAATPSLSLQSNNILFLNGPDGSVWFATGDTEVEEIELPGGYATEKRITAFTYTIYDNNFQEVGKVHDVIRLEEGETRAAEVALGTTVSKKFYNTNANPEITVTLVMNKAELLEYPYVNVRTNVYSVGGNKTEEGTDEILMTIPGMPVSAVNTATDSWSENFYISYVDETAGSIDDYSDYIEYLATIKNIVTTYSKAGWSGGPSVFDVTEFQNVRLPGDAMSNPYFISCVKDGKLTFITSEYEKSFFVDPSGMSGNEDVTEDNHLIVKVRQVPSAWSSEMTEIASVSIPTIQNVDEQILCTFYSVGSLMYDGDVDFGHYTTDGTPAFVITAADYSSLNDDQYIESYYVYDATGNRIMTLAEKTESYLLLNDIAGEEPQAMFIYNEGSSYTYDFVDLYSGTTALTIAHRLDNKTISTSLERVKTAKGILYAASLNSASTDANGDTFHEVGWINGDGAFDRIDRINLGKNVAVAQVYISASALNPYLFNTDEAQEYLFLVKRYITADNSATQEELLVIAPESEPMLTIEPDATKGTLLNVGLLATSDPKLLVSFRGADDVLTTEFYDLPLAKFAGGDGSAENPYLIATAGDLQQMKFNTAANYRLANDIDCGGLDFVTIPTFSGSLDGAAHTVRNLTITGRGIFKNSVAGASFKNLTFVDAAVLPAGSTFSYTGLLVGEAQGTTVDNVHVFGLKAESADFDDVFGSLLGRGTLNSAITASQVAGAVINFPKGKAGGIIGGMMTGTNVIASAFTGSITGESEVGGITASMHTDGTVADCHVNANLTASHTIGGIVASSNRAPVSRNHVEGTITATGANRWQGYCVGGIVGSLASSAKEDVNVIISGNFVGLESITVDPSKLGTPAYAGAFDSAHRIVGWSRGNDEPDVVGYDDEWEPIYSTDPVLPEAGLADNYVISDLEIIQNTIDDAHTSTEGLSKSRWELEQEFMEGLGFKFGTDTENPWNLQSIWTPKLHFETAAIIETAQINTIVGETFNIVVRLLDRSELTLDDVLGDFTMDYDMAKVEMTGAASVVNNVLSIEMKAIAEGSSEFTVGVLGTTVQGTVNAEVSGIDSSVVADAAIAIRYNGSEVTAAGCALELYTVAGTKVAAGADALSTAGLAAGVYIVRASNGTATATAKIAVR